MESPPRSRLFWRIAPVAVVFALIGGYEKFFSKKSPAPVAAIEQVGAGTAQEPTGRFRCDGRTHCSQMSSCTEAKFFLKNCPGVQMDGNNDGVPCEKQWCTGPLSR